MFGIPLSSLLALGVVGAIWLIGLWKSARYALPERPGSPAGLPEISRKVLFHVVALAAAAGPAHTVLFGMSRFSLQIWAAGGSEEESATQVLHWISDAVGK